MGVKNDTLLILIPGFPSDESDTTCLPAQQALVRALNVQYPQLRVNIIAFQYPNHTDPYTWHGNHVIPLNGRNRGRLFRMITWFKAWRAFTKLHKQVQVIGILSCWLNECAMVGHLLSKKYNIPQLTWLLGQDALQGNRYAGLIRPAAPALAAISDRLAENYFHTYGTTPAHIIPNGINPALFAHGVADRNIDIIGVGSLIALKQFDIFIDIIAALNKQLPGLRVMLCGDGPEKEKLQAQITGYGLENTILLTGELKHEEILKRMQRSKILLHTSSYEGFSGACLEALYAGAHVVSFFAPMHAWIRHWHIVADSKTAINKITELLRNHNLDHDSVLPYHMEDSAVLVMQALGYSPAS